MALFAFFASPIPYQHVPIRDRRNSSDIAFGVWASVALVGLAIASVALGIAPVVDPVIFATP
jgi:hypothetical protein